MREPVVNTPGSQPSLSSAAVPGGDAPSAERATSAVPAPSPSLARQPTTSGNAATASEPDAAAILARVEAAYDDVRSLQADFVQRLTVPLLGSTQQSRGKFYQRRPDRIALRFTDPAGDLLVGDGEHFWMYYPSSDPKQVVRASMNAGTEQVDLQRQFLDNASERYVVTLSGEESVDGRPADVLTLVPRGESPYQRIRVWVDRRDALVRRFEITEDNDSVRRLEFRNLELNGTIPNSVFRFAPPAGAQVFDQ